MDIFHHVSFNSLSQKILLDAINDISIRYKTTEVPGGGGQIISFDIFESDPNWNKVYELLNKYEGLDIYGSGDGYETVFSEEDVRKAEWVRLISTFEHGYPQPEANWPFKQFTYENVCPKCAIHQQIGNFRFKKEPNLKKCSFMTPLAVGELFCTAEVFFDFEAIGANGFNTKEVIINNTKKTSDRVQQLYISTVAKPGLLDTDEMQKTICLNCGTTKYYSHKKGVMKLKRSALPVGVDFAKTHEWFGVGYIAYQEILVSNKVAQLILDKGWQGVRMKVVELV